LIRVKVLTGGRWRSLAGWSTPEWRRSSRSKAWPWKRTSIRDAAHQQSRPAGFIGAWYDDGEANINIATFHSGAGGGPGRHCDRGHRSNRADAIQQKLRALPHVKYVKVLKF